MLDNDHGSIKDLFLGAAGDHLIGFRINLGLGAFAQPAGVYGLSGARFSRYGVIFVGHWERSTRPRKSAFGQRAPSFRC